MEEEEQLLLTKEFDAVQEGWNKLTSGVSSVIGSGVRAADDFIDQNIPGGEQFTARWRKGAVRILEGTARFVQQEFEAADRQVDEPIDSPGDIPYFVAGAFNRGKEQYTENARSMAESAGIDPRAGDVLGEVAGEIATFGAGKMARAALDAVPPGTGRLSPQVAMAGGMAAPVQLTPQITKGGVVMKAVTINNPKALETTGRKLGEEIIENDPALAKHLAERSVNMQRLENKIDRGLELQKLYKKDLSKRPEYKTAQRQVKKSRPALYSETSNVKPFTEQDPQQYGISTKATKQVKEDWIKKRVEKNLTISEKVHEHHLVTKGGTAAAFRKMEDFIKKGKAHPDDLVVMFEYAEKKGVAPGDRLSNIAMIQDTPHSELHKQVLIPAGDEFKQAQWDKILKELKTPEDLMDWWVDQVDNNYVPNKNTGLIWQDLDDLIKEVRASK